MRSNELILLVEDDENDIILIHRGFAQGGLTNPIQVTRSGEEAMAYLSAVGKYTNRDEYPLPILILLDLHLPGMSGFDLLSWIRQQDGISGIPIIVLTSSGAVRDVNRAYAAGANSFFLKDIDLKKAMEFSSLLRQYWLHRALTPETYRDPNLPQNNKTYPDAVNHH